MRPRAHAWDDRVVMTQIDTIRRAYRDTDAGVIGGVAAGLADHLAVPVFWVRAGFVVATVLGGLGVALYAGLWWMLPLAGPVASTPGGEAATRRGLRPPRGRRLADVGPSVALLALGIGAILIVEAVVGRAWIFWPLLVGLVGVALLWRQADEAQRERWLDTTGHLDPVRMVLGSRGWASYARVAAGILLVLVSLGLFTLRGGRLSDARDLVLALLIALVGIAVVIGPWVWQLIGALAAERAERVRTQERADLAAHLHDSVLQTLALIQRNAHDPATVTRLARSQERDLRGWLYDVAPAGAETVAGALKEAAAETEDSFGALVDVVVVGDAPLTEDLRAITGATREALANAAKHAGTGQASLYAEVTDAAVEVFVRDRGPGFDVSAVPSDRHGVRGSIIDRMERHGGTATIRCASGGGTEVSLRQPRTTKEES